MTDTLFDRAIIWLEAHPRATGIIIAALILAVVSGVGFFDGPKP